MSTTDANPANDAENEVEEVELQADVAVDEGPVDELPNTAEDAVVDDAVVDDAVVDDAELAEPAVITDEHRRAIEAIIMVAEDPVAPHLLAQLTELPAELVEQVCGELAAEYADEGRGFALVRVAGGYRFQTVTDVAPYVERFVLEGQTSRLSAAALETLAIVAYKQPISRAQVAGIRGVNVDAVLRTLQQRGYVDEIARDPGPGQAVLFGTTPLFLDKMGLDSLGQLPSLGDFMPAPEVVEILEQSLRPERLDLDEAIGDAEASVAEEALADESALVGQSASRKSSDADDDILATDEEVAAVEVVAEAEQVLAAEVAAAALDTEIDDTEIDDTETDDTENSVPDVMLGETEDAVIEDAVIEDAVIEDAVVESAELDEETEGPNDDPAPNIVEGDGAVIIDLRASANDASSADSEDGRADATDDDRVEAFTGPDADE